MWGQRSCEQSCSIFTISCPLTPIVFVSILKAACYSWFVIILTYVHGLFVKLANTYRAKSREITFNFILEIGQTNATLNFKHCISK